MKPGTVDDRGEPSYIVVDPHHNVIGGPINAKLMLVVLPACFLEIM